MSTLGSLATSNNVCTSMLKGLPKPELVRQTPGDGGGEGAGTGGGPGQIIHPAASSVESLL